PRRFVDNLAEIGVSRNTRAIFLFHSHHLPSLSLCAASNSCSRRFIAAGSDMFSCASAFMISVGMPYGLGACGKGFGVVRLFIDIIVFCLDEGFPAHAIANLASALTTQLDC